MNPKKVNTAPAAAKAEASVNLRSITNTPMAPSTSPRSSYSSLAQIETSTLWSFVPARGSKTTAFPFGVFFGVVAATLRELLGEAWTAPIDAAWTDLLADLDFYVKHPDQRETAMAG